MKRYENLNNCWLTWPLLVTDDVNFDPTSFDSLLALQCSLHWSGTVLVAPQ